MCVRGAGPSGVRDKRRARETGLTNDKASVGTDRTRKFPRVSRVLVVLRRGSAKIVGRVAGFSKARVDIVGENVAFVRPSSKRDTTSKGRRHTLERGGGTGNFAHAKLNNRILLVSP